MQINNFYVYLHRRLDTNEVFYVGKGKNKRAWSTENRNIYWQRIVAKAGYKIEIAVGSMTEDQAFQCEKDMIAYWRYSGQAVANMTDGGEGVSGYVKSKELLQKHSERMKGKNNPFYGKKHTEATIETIKQKNKGKTLSEEHKKKLLAFVIGRKKSAEELAKLSERMSGENNPIADLKEYTFLHKSGKEFTGTRVKFRDASGLNSIQVASIVSGKTLSIFGWHLKGVVVPDNRFGMNAPCVDKNIYNFVNRNGDVFTGTRMELCEKYSLNRNGLSKLFVKKNRSESMYGWSLLQNPAGNG